MPVGQRADTAGPQLFARYAYAPNQLGYCGPSEGAALRDGSDDEIRAVARRFSGAWPYLQVLSRMTGIADPLDHRLVESYWLGGGVGDRLDPAEFYAELLAVIGPQAGHYWTHLTPELADEAAGNHCFHVFGVYPWSRLLGKGMDEHPLRILDSCRITPAEVLAREGDRIEVRGRQLTWDGRSLNLSEPCSREVEVFADGYSAVPDVAVGEHIALHWDRICGRLEPAQVQAVDESTSRQLSRTNRRLAVALG
ncbi:MULTISPECIES: DUF6390 family protein [Mycolicibacterium]|uniref:DUF6390 family protein n=1 Tax=Mycolicibacterium TaxID=1866885 RepID=UPI0007ECAE84|nr:hypothetical protein [Mycolicibacterium fortuitum]NOP95473.1 hypothetical protein [Mycolicibacterium fortuitum]OBK06612.1 hypothetical protein A5637_06730 [Mycolicibacterium fortuitum]UBV17253.1 hypothetical protein H8Z57_10985 [Mycolicibacterium fortuitum]